MAEMRTQAERFGAEIIRGNVAKVDLSQPPVHGDDLGRQLPVPDADHRHRRFGATAGAALRAQADGPRRLDLRHLRRLLLPRQADRGRRRRRLGHGRSDLPDQVRVEGHGGSSSRHAARVEDHAGQGVRQPEDRLGVEQRGRGHQRHRARAPLRRWCSGTT